MPQPPSKCPNEHCPTHSQPESFSLRKKGKYKSPRTGRLLQRYQCKECGLIFTSQTGENPQGYRKDVSRELFGLACSGTTIRRSAQLLGISVNTVRGRLLDLAAKARQAHLEAHRNGSLRTEYVQFDEMITFLHARAKPLAIAMAVRAKTGQILAIKVGRIPASGRLAAKGQSVGWTVNDGPIIRRLALTEAAQSVLPGATFACDGWPTYPSEIRTYVPQCGNIEVYPTRVGVGFDPLFRLNHVCAKIRADIACMARETWTTTKDIARLQDRLDIYVGWNNGYVLS